jgi:glycerate dehydrogenase
MSKIVVLDGRYANPGDLTWKSLKDIDSVTIYQDSKPEQIVERCKGAQYIVTNKCIIDRTIMDQLQELKCICVSATGYNVVDIEHARGRVIDVCNVKGYSTTGVAQHVFAMLLHITNEVSRYNASVSAGEWDQSKGWSYWFSPINELRGMTLGLLGYGDIAQEVSKIGQSFGMRVITHRRRRELHQDPAVRHVGFEELFAQSDVLSLHAPLTPDTQFIVNEQSLSLMKPTAILINTGRGGLINETALAQSLSNGRIAHAAVDVLGEEPPKADCPLIGIDNCIITPHQAWASKQSRMRLIDGVADNIRAHMSGSPQNVVN